MASQQELADMERMSSDYIPETTVLTITYYQITSRLTTFGQGPFVGEQQSTQALVKEYAQADPIYVHKTKVCSKDH